MGVSMLAFLVALKMLSKRVKKLHWTGAMGPILACAIGIAAVAIGNLQNRGIKIVEKIPQGGGGLLRASGCERACVRLCVHLGERLCVSVCVSHVLGKCGVCSFDGAALLIRSLSAAPLLLCVGPCQHSKLQRACQKVRWGSARQFLSVPCPFCRAGLPPPTIHWWVPVKDVGPMLGLAAVVMLVDLLESTSIARALAR